jgi:hypothetical protein
MLKSRPALKISTYELKSRPARQKYFLLECRPALKSSTWDVEEQASPENLLGMLKKASHP